MAPKTPKTPSTPVKTPCKTSYQPTEWKICDICSSIFLPRDSFKHESLCSTIVTKEYSPTELNGFVVEKQFFTVFDEVRCPNDCVQYASKLRKTHIILISPCVMKLCSIEIGSHVLIESCDSGWKSTFIAWPCSHIQPLVIYIDSEVLKAHFQSSQPSYPIKISPLPKNIHLASSVHLKVVGNKPKLKFNELEDSFLHQYEGQVISRGISLVLRDYGKKWILLVENIHTQSTIESEDSDGIEEKMKTLTLDSADQVYSLIFSKTKVTFEGFSTDSLASVAPRFELSDFGGSHDIVNEIKKMCSSIFQSTSTVKRNAPRGVLIFGPSGTGKSLLVQAVAHHFQVPLVTIQGPELYSKYYGETETRLRAKFDEAIKNDIGIIFMDEIDALCPRKDSGSSSHSDQERRVVATLLSMLDSIPSHSRIVVMGVTNRPDFLDSALRRPGRLDRELEVRAPTVADRREILTALLRKIPHQLEEKDVAHLATVTHGFVGADLSLLCAEASLAAAKRVIASGHSDDESMASDAQIRPEDANQALHLVKPSAMREVLVEVPNVRWSDIGGQSELKLKLKQAVEWPLLYPDSFQRLGVEPPRGLLMFGPPGCSKTMIAKALATESGLNFIAVKGPELFSKWVGESERAVREVFRRARQVAPAIVFLDELDALGSARGASSSAGVGDRVLAQLLTEMDGIEALKDVTVVAATNRPDMIDKALLRPGRLDRIVYVPLPDEATRREILQLKFKTMPIHQQVSLDWLVSQTPGYSGAEVTAVCNEAALRALEEDIEMKEIYQRHFDFALSAVTPRISVEDIVRYEKYIIDSGMHAI